MSMSNSMSTTQPMISCQQLSKHFGRKHVLKSLSFDLDSGAPIALVGPNGAGKTTLFSILCGYLPPSSGSVRIFGHPPGAKALFGRVTALPQDAQLNERFSIAHQLMFYAQLQGFSKKAARIEAERVLALVDLADVIDERPGALSHGMRKRATIAQALIGDPELIMLDEPTAGLDPLNARNIRQMVAEQSDKTTFIISSHNLSELERLSQTVLYLEKGQISQHADISSKATTSFLTIQMTAVNDSDPMAKFSALTGVIQVKQSQKNDYMIEYDIQINAALDQHLLACIAENGWTYHQLIKGKTLEDQLFS